MENIKFTVDSLREKMEKDYKYYSDEMVQYRTFLGLLNFVRKDVNAAQDIYALCLEGPPGVGKTMFAKIYKKLVEDIYGGEVEFIDFTCSKDTGKTELVEEINVYAVVMEDGTRVNIPGKIVDAIKKVNTGKRVILFIDEYDKARRDTDSFFNSFLQSGNLNAVQHGDMEIKEEYKNNIQVIFCKNDPDVELTEAMQRRVRIIRLDYITPEKFYTIAKRNLIDDRKEEDRVQTNLLDLVALIYSKVYKMKDLFSRLPATSEMLIAIEEADSLIKKGNAPKSIIYRVLMEDIFKDPDSITTFNSILSENPTENDKIVIKLLDEMKNDKSSSNISQTIDELLARSINSEKRKELEEKVELAKSKIDEYDRLIKGLQGKNQENSGEINIGSGYKLLENGKNNVYLSNFQDETAYVKRGKSVFQNRQSWTFISSVKCNKLCNMNLLGLSIRNANKLNVVFYEDGMEFKTTSGNKIILTRIKNNDGNEYLIYCDTPLLLPSDMNTLNSVIEFIKQINGEDISDIDINAIIYNESDINILQKLDDYFYICTLKDESLLQKIATYETVTSKEKYLRECRNLAQKSTTSKALK